MGERPSATALALNVGAMMVLLAVAAWAFAPVFATQAWIVAVAGALVVGASIGTFAAVKKWPVVVTVGVGVLAYFLAGGPLVLRSTTAAGVVPTPSSIVELARGLVSAWKDLLTVQVPTEGLEVVVLVPFISTLVCTTVGVALAARATRAGWAVLAPLTLLSVAIAFGTYRGASPVIQAVVFAAVALPWLAWRREAQRAPAGDGGSTVSKEARARRTVLAAGVLAAALVVGTSAAALDNAPEQRKVLRDHVTPPLELHDYSSPLQSFRKYVRDFEDTTLFTVSHLPEGARVHLATLDAYDGIVYAVSGDGTAAGGSFERVGTSIPLEQEGTAARIDITMGSMSGVWVPTVGHVRSVDFTGTNEHLLDKSLHYNRTTGTAVATVGLREGDAYSLDVVIPPAPSEDELTEASFSGIPLPRVSGVPEGLREAAIDAAGDDRTPASEVASLVTFLSGSGYFSHGLEGQAPSRSGHGGERIAALLGAPQMVGDDEQYAVAFALMANQLGIPARVVMGFYPDDPVEGPYNVTGADVHVWAEVAYDGLGWVPVDPSPAEDKAPIQEEQPPQREPKPQVLQPPPPPQEPAQVPPAVPTDDEAVDETRLDLEAVLRVAVYVLGALGVLLILVGPFLAVIIAKMRRRRRRRRQGSGPVRIAGAWNELADAAVDHGAVVPPHVTRVEKAAAVDAFIGAPLTTPLAHKADSHVWVHSDPTDQEVADYWREVEATVAALGKRRSVRERWKARVSLRSLAQERQSRRSRPERTVRVLK